MGNRKYYWQSCLIWIIYILGSNILLCQNNIVPIHEFPHQIYKVSDGLSQSQVTCVYQDTYGFIWAGTKEGINRFDGIRFENYKTNSLYPDDYISDITEDASGNIWIAGQGGVYKFDGLNFENLLPKSLRGEVEPNRIFVLSNKEVRFLSADNQLYFLDDKSCLNIKIKFPQLEGQIIERAEIYNTDNLLLITHGGDNFAQGWRLEDTTLVRFDLGTHSAKPSTWLYNHNGERLFVKIQNIIYTFENNQLIVYKTLGKLFTKYRFIIRGKDIILYQRYERFSVHRISGEETTNYGLDLNLVWEVIQDRSGRLWIGTENGLVKIKSEAFINYPEHRGMVKGVWTIVEDDKEQVWFGSYGNGLCVLEDNQYTYLDSLTDNDQFYMGGLKRDNGDLLFPVSDNVLKYNVQRKGFQRLLKNNSRAVLSLFEDVESDRIYIGSKGLYVYNAQSEVSLYSDPDGLDMNKLKYITAINKDTTGTFWLGSHTGMAKFDGKKFQSYYSGEGKDFEGGIISIFKDFKDNLWFGSHSGLFHYNYNSDIPHSIEDNLLDKSIYFINSIDSSFLTFGTIDDLILLDLKKYYNGELVLHRIGKEKGFDAKDCGQNGSCVTRNGDIWITSAEMVVKMIPEKLELEKHEAQLFITSIASKTDNMEKYEYQYFSFKDDSLLLIKAENNIKINFITVNHSSPTSLKYQVKLDGKDDHWAKEDFGNHHLYKEYTNLKTGKYTFKVRVFLDAELLDEKIVDILILPSHFTQENWFVILVRIIVFFVLSGLILLIFKLYSHTRKQKELKKKLLSNENELLKIKYKAVVNQVDAHFMFNAMSAIGGLIAMGKTVKARSYIDTIAYLLRVVIYDDNGKVTRTLGEEVKFVKSYLEMERLRLSDIFEYSLFIDKNVDLNVFVPKMIIQTFANNAVKHGMENLTEEGKIQINVSQSGNIVNIKVSDNGDGFIEKDLPKNINSGGKGIYLIKKILGWLDDESLVQSSVDFNKREPNGMEVSIQIPTNYRYI